MLLNNSCTREKNYNRNDILFINDNENGTNSTLSCVLKAVHRENYIVVNACIRKFKSPKINETIYQPKILEKEQKNKQKNIECR